MATKRQHPELLDAFDLAVAKAGNPGRLASAIGYTNASLYKAYRVRSVSFRLERALRAYLAGDQAAAVAESARVECVSVRLTRDDALRLYRLLGDSLGVK